MIRTQLLTISKVDYIPQYLVIFNCFYGKWQSTSGSKGFMLTTVLLSPQYGNRHSSVFLTSIPMKAKILWAFTQRFLSRSFISQLLPKYPCCAAEWFIQKCQLSIMSGLAGLSGEPITLAQVHAHIRHTSDEKSCAAVHTYRGKWFYGRSRWLQTYS